MAALRNQIGAPLHTGQQSAYEQIIATTQAHLAAQEWQKAWSEGQTMPLEQLAVRLIPYVRNWQARSR